MRPFHPFDLDDTGMRPWPGEEPESNLGWRQRNRNTRERMDTHAERAHNGVPDPDCPRCQAIVRGFTGQTPIHTMVL